MLGTVGAKKQRNMLHNSHKIQNKLQKGTKFIWISYLIFNTTERRVNMIVFKPRLTRPEKGNKYYNTISNGGYSKAIKGKPTDSQCDVLSN